MSWTVLYSASAARSIRGLDPQVRRRVRAAIEALMDDPLRGKALHMTLKGLRSWRTGDFRVIYRVIEQRLEIHVVAVGHRGDVYARLRKRLG